MDNLNRVRELAGLPLLESHVSSAIELEEAVSKQIFLDFSKELIDIKRTDDNEVFTATLNGLGYIQDPEEEVDLDNTPVTVTIDTFGQVEEGEFKIVSVVGNDGTQYVLDETDNWDITILAWRFSDAMAIESAEAVDEAGGYYTKGVWKLIDAHGADAVLREMLRFLHADVIQDFTNHMHDADAMSFESTVDEGHYGKKKK